MSLTRVLLIVFLSVSLSLLAENSFEGKITYVIHYSGPEEENFRMYLPEKYIYIISGNNVKVIVEGGITAAMFGEVLYIGEEKTTYMLHHDSKTAFRLINDEAIKNDTEPIIIDENETEQILDYECHKYKIITFEGGEELAQIIWATDMIQLPAELHGMGSENYFMIRGVKGFPLRIKSHPDPESEMLIEAIEIEKGNVQESELSIPTDYKIEVFNPNLIF